ncbi:MAG TPA: thermonuclease family protein [Acidimicrobiales bacterium]|nr:thermonuclease family protein [Acidimicrobiales bacterium]
MKRSDRRRSPVLVLVVMLLAGAAAVTVVIAVSGTTPPPEPRAGAAGGGLPAGLDVTVERVVDGDTIVVSGGERVRLIGVDTPETKDPRRPVGCFGKQASDFTAALLPAGSRVRLEGDVEQRDRYQRLLAYVYRLPDGLFVNAELLRRGFGQVLTIPPNVAHSDDFVALAREAREDDRGLWGACGGQSP